MEGFFEGTIARVLFYEFPLPLVELRDSVSDTRILLHVVGIIVPSIVLDHVLLNFQYLDMHF